MAIPSGQSACSSGRLPREKLWQASYRETPSIALQGVSVACLDLLDPSDLQGHPLGGLHLHFTDYVSTLINRSLKTSVTIEIEVEKG